MKIKKWLSLTLVGVMCLMLCYCYFSTIEIKQNLLNYSNTAKCVSFSNEDKGCSSFSINSSSNLYEIKLNEQFDTFDNRRWIKKNVTDDTLTFDGKATFSQSFNTAEGNLPKLAFNMPVYANGDGVVFDITFSAKKTEGKINEAVNFGFMFGMPSIDAEITDEKVGYLNFTATDIQMYRAGSLVQSQTDIKNRIDFAYIKSSITTVRLIAKDDGTLQLYVGKQYEDYSVSIEQLYATYSGFDFNNTYLAFVTNETFNSQTEKEFSVYISDVKLDTCISIDFSTIDLDIVFDETSLSEVFVSEDPIEIVHEVSTRYSYSPFIETEIQIVSGQASVLDDCIIFHTHGDVSFRIISAFDKSIYKEYSVNVKKVEIESVVIDKQKFVDLTSDSQPLDLIAEVKGNSSKKEHLAYTFNVISGKAEIVYNQLRLLGPGEVVIRATSVVDPTKYEQFAFTVADANKDYIKISFEQNNGQTVFIVVGSVVVGLLLTGLVVVLVKKKKKGS